MSLSNPLLFNKPIDTCYFSCRTDDEGKSYVCKKMSKLDKASENNAYVTPTNCACPAYAQVFRLMRNLQSNHVTIL